MADVSLILGVIEFLDYEVPHSINFGGAQALSVKKLVGGKRIIDAMGRDDDDISWSGLFFGENAALRAQLLDTERVLGSELPLTFYYFNYLVVIKEFKCDFQRFYQIPYSITVAVVQDLNKPFESLSPTNYNDAINNDLNTSNRLSAASANPILITDMANVTSAITAIPSMMAATPTQISAVLATIGQTQQDLSVSIIALNTLIFPDGIHVNPSLTNDEISLDLNQLSDLYQMQFVLARMSENIQLINSGTSGTVLMVNGANLFQLAAKYYNDATKWTVIAQANNIFDPEVLPGIITTLIIPKSGQNTGGLISR